MDLTLPIAFLVPGTPIAWQAKRAAAKLRWKAQVREASLTVLPEGHFATEGRLAVTLFYFPAEREGGDIDNVVKLVLDALVGHLYLDDAQVGRIVVQKLAPDLPYPFSAPDVILRAALSGPKPVLYIRVSDDPFEDLA